MQCKRGIVFGVWVSPCHFPNDRPPPQDYQACGRLSWSGRDWRIACLKTRWIRVAHQMATTSRSEAAFQEPLLPPKLMLIFLFWLLDKELQPRLQRVCRK